MERSAPASNNVETIEVLPQAAALHNGEKLSIFCKFRSALLSTRSWAISDFPKILAIFSGVFRNSSS